MASQPEQEGANAVDVPPVIGRTASGGFKTTDGTLYVTKPFRSNKAGKKLRAMVAFTPRKSAFDTTNELSGANEFRGFFTLFWISMFLLMIRTYVRSHEEHGYFMHLGFARKFSQDAITLALSDATLVASTGICVPFAKAVAAGWVKYYWLGVAIQHLFQTAVLGIAVTWTFNRQWPWVQSGFLTLHAIVMLMKMHSYMAVNGYLASIHTQAEHTRKALHATAITESGSYESAVDIARERRAALDAEVAGTNVMPLSAAGTSMPTLSDKDGVTTSYLDPNDAQVLRQRLVTAAAKATAGEALAPGAPPSITRQDSTQPTPPRPTGLVPTAEKLKPGPNAPSVHPLIDHPSEAISALAQELSELEGELTSSGPEYVRWPANITWKNFAVYQLIPTLVYELEYPRTDRIRPLYVFEKTVATAGTFALLYSVTESFILTRTPTSEESFLRSLLDLALPFMVAYLLLFYIIFECICNGFAELSYFADRQFYEDWWNSTSWDEFSRKWNKPVHTFLLRHVYAATISTFRLSRAAAMFTTFLLSACVHELVMAIVTKKIRMYLFSLQLIQIPLIAMGRLPAIKRNKLAGNIVFWLGLFAGFPLLCVAYVAY